MSRHVISAVLLWVVLTAVGEATVFLDWFPTVGSHEAEDFDEIFLILVAMGTPVFAFVIAVIAYAVLNFRSKGPEETGATFLGVGTGPGFESGGGEFEDGEGRVCILSLDLQFSFGFLFVLSDYPPDSFFRDFGYCSVTLQSCIGLDSGRLRNLNTNEPSVAFSHSVQFENSVGACARAGKEIQYQVFVVRISGNFNNLAKQSDWLRCLKDSSGDIVVQLGLTNFRVKLASLPDGLKFPTNDIAILIRCECLPKHTPSPINLPSNEL